MLLKLSKGCIVSYVTVKKIYLLGSLGSIKFNENSSNIISENNSNLLLVRKKLLGVCIKNKRISYVNKLSKLLINNLFGSLGKFKIVGLGYRLLYNDNQLFFKLGYSHIIYTHLSLIYYTKKKKKKKKFVSIGSISDKSLNMLINKIQSYRIPDKYCSNGIYNRLTSVTFIDKKTSIF
jgi:ribosomal protein L6P/L9E